MATSLKLTGLDGFHKWRLAAKDHVKEAMVAATVEVLFALEIWAKENLDRDIYNKDHGAYAQPLTYHLYRSFVMKMPIATGLRVYGSISNQAPEAVWLEYGTDDEGTGKHMIPVVSAGALHWVDAYSGEDMFSKGHMVKGITPIHFMEKSFTEHIPQIEAIYLKHLRGALAK